MSKIKQINISDFRIFEGTQEFQFQNANGIANLVALYAPNGYGKTSFFDAVEWGYSDKIQRLEQKVTSDSIKHEEDFGKDDKVILTNRQSYDQGKKGIVEVITTDKRFKKEVVFRKVQNVETKNDYRTGKFVHSDFLKTDLKELPKTNVLSQDQIDRFLRYKSPEEKFNELKDFWTEGEETLNKYKNVEDTLKDIDRKVKELKEKQTKLNDELKQIVFEPKKLDDINKVLEELEKEVLIEYKFSQLKEPLTKELFDALSKELILAEKGLEKKIKSEEDKRLQLEQLIAKYIFYKENLRALKPVTTDIQQISEKKKFFDHLNAANKQKEEIENQLLKINEKLSDYRKIVNNRILFLETEKKVNELKKNKEKSNRVRQRIEVDVAITDKWISSLTRSKSNLLGEANKYQTEEERFKLLFERYSSDLVINKKDKEQRPILNKNIKEIKKEIDSKNELIRKYQNYITEKKWIKETFETTAWQEKVDEYILISKDFKNKKEDLKGKKEKLQKSGSLEENLHRIG